MPSNQVPTSEVCPGKETTDARDCVALCRKAGLEPLEWQSLLLDTWLGRGEDGKWTAKSCGLSVPRQNGKTLGVVAARIVYGMIVLGEEVVYTAHLQKTATETYEEVRDLLLTPALKRYVKTVRNALGREQLTLKNGARIKFLARTRNGGRGQHGDLLIFDEAQELSDRQQGSFLPAMSARPNSQALYIGTPPDESADGTVFTRMRERALSGETKRTAWAEWAVDEIGDVSDRARWERCNPSFGVLLDPVNIEGELEDMATDEFARERLGWWAPKKEAEEAEKVFEPSDWELCECLDAPDGAPAFGVKFSPDGERVSLAVAIKGKRPYVELIDSRSTSHGTSWLVEFLERSWRSSTAITIDGRSGAQQLHDELRRRNVPKTVLSMPKTSDVVAASSGLLNAVREHAVSHIESPAMDECVLSAVKRPIGSTGGWGFARVDGGDVTPVEAASLALRAAMESRRDPTRKQVLL